MKNNAKCPECGKEFYHPEAEGDPNLYCSKECGKKGGLSDDELE